MTISIYVQIYVISLSLYIIYIYIYVCVYIYIYICIYTNTYIYIYIYIYVRRKYKDNRKYTNSRKTNTIKFSEFITGQPADLLDQSVTAQREEEIRSHAVQAVSMKHGAILLLITGDCSALLRNAMHGLSSCYVESLGEGLEGPGTRPISVLRFWISEGLTQAES